MDAGLALAVGFVALVVFAMAVLAFAATAMRVQLRDREAENLRTPDPQISALVRLREERSRLDEQAGLRLEAILQGFSRQVKG